MQVDTYHASVTCCPLSQCFLYLHILLILDFFSRNVIAHLLWAVSLLPVLRKEKKKPQIPTIDDSSSIKITVTKKNKNNVSDNH